MAFVPTYDPKKPIDRDKLLTVAISAQAAPTRSGANRVNEIDATEAQWQKDFPAYKRLRKEGLRPATSKGAADLESRAEGAHEVEGRPSPRIIERVQELGAEVTNAG